MAPITITQFTADKKQDPEQRIAAALEFIAEMLGNIDGTLQRIANDLKKQKNSPDAPAQTPEERAAEDAAAEQKVYTDT